MRKNLFLLAASVALCLPASAHAYCFSTLYPQPGTLCGTVDLRGYNGSSFVARPAGSTYVKICPAGSPNSGYCRTTTTTSYRDAYNNPVEAWTFSGFGGGMMNSAWYDLYAWGAGNAPWGSDSKPIQRIAVDRTGGEGILLLLPPRPLEPTPVYPSGESVPSSFTVVWKSGIDTDRQPYPVKYEVWYKYWPFGGTEPANWSLSRADMPCQDDGSGPDANNECSTYVAGPQPAGNWKWYVVAHLNVSAVTPSFPNNWFTTKSGGVSFTQPE